MLIWEVENSPRELIWEVENSHRRIQASRAKEVSSPGFIKLQVSLKLSIKLSLLPL